MSLIGNIAVEGACKHILGKLDEIAAKTPEAADALTELREYIDGIRATAEAGWY